MAWLCHIPVEFQIHLTFYFLYRYNNRDISEQMIFQQFLRFQKKPFPLFLMFNIRLDEIPRKIKQKIWLLYCISNFAGGSYKKLRDTATVLLFLDVLHQQRTSFTIIRKNIFDMSFPFLMDSPQPLRPTLLTVKIHKVW